MNQSVARLPALLWCLASWIAPARAQEPALPDTLTLSWLERAVSERNPALTQAKAAAAEAKARARRAGALEGPMLDVMVAPRSLGSEAVDPAYRVGLMQSFPLFGQRGLQRRAAEAEATVAETEERGIRLDLQQQTREAFLSYYRGEIGLETNSLLAELLMRLRGIALTRYKAGLVGQQDPLQAEVEIATLQHERASLERQRRVAIARLNALLHRGAARPLPPPSRSLPEERHGTHGDSLPALALRLRPEIAAARARLLARRAQLALARRERWPETSFGLAYDRFWMEPELRPTVSVELRLPFGFGRIAALEAEARAAALGAEADLARREDQVGREVEETVAELEETLHELRIVGEALVPATERAFEATRAAYEASRSDLPALLGAAREFARARLLLDETRAMAVERRAALSRAVGLESLEVAR